MHYIYKKQVKQQQISNVGKHETMCKINYA